MKTVNQGYFSDFSAMLHNDYHSIWAYGFDVYEYHRFDTNHKVRWLENYYVCDINTRSGHHMSQDLVTILNVIRSLDERNI